MSYDEALLERMFRNVGLYFARCARASPGGQALHFGSVRAAVMPAMPEASIVNCVTYGDAGDLESCVDELADAYDRAGVRAWAVWTHEHDEAARDVLAAEGFVLDSEPMAMALGLDGALEPPAPEELDWTLEPDPRELADVVEASYGFPAGLFAAGFPELPDVHAYLARDDQGRPASVVMASDLEGDCGIFLVGTIPEARGRGISTRLMRRTLADAANRGCTISTLQASKMGHPVYRQLGYRDLGRAELWERRKNR
jgi:GNAT superfamily N-acetyltransferase